MTPEAHVEGRSGQFTVQRINFKTTRRRPTNNLLHKSDIHRMVYFMCQEDARVGDELDPVEVGTSK